MTSTESLWHELRDFTKKNRITILTGRSRISANPLGALILYGKEEPRPPLSFKILKPRS